MKCLWCDKEILIEVSWLNFLYPDISKKICSACEEALELLDRPLCAGCGRMSEKDVCQDCERWEQDPKWRGVLAYNRSIYAYNPMLQDIIAKWKYRGDYQLREMFQESLKTVFKQTFKTIAKNAVIVPIPLSQDRLNERVFNQAEALADLLGLPYTMALSRSEGDKQSKKTRQERITGENPFEIVEIVTTPVILIDDIYTTGTTIRHAARTLRETGCPQVYSFTLAR